MEGLINMLLWRKIFSSTYGPIYNAFLKILCLENLEKSIINWSIRATKVYSVLILYMERFILSFLERRGFICVAGHTGED